jgi:hypothetical protein
MTREPVGFEQSIRPLFREKDRQAMLFVLDLWSYEDVHADAKNILDRIEDGTMPCDDPWNNERIQVFRDWIMDGRRP